MKNTKKRYAFLWICAAIVNIKSIFCDYDLDAAYTVAMSYRHINGDRLFLKMWEPHQTSIFFVDFFALLWRKITGSFDGVALWLQLCGCLIFLAVALLLFGVMKKIASEEIAMLTCIFFWVQRPKSTQILDYSNLLVLLSTLLFILLMQNITSKKKNIHAILMGICASGLVLAYPSALIVAIVAGVFLVMWSDNRVKDVLIYCVTCLSLAMCYLILVSRNTSIGSILENIEYIVQGDTHSSFRYSGFDFFREILIGCGIAAISFAIAILYSYKKRSTRLAVIRSFFVIQTICYLAIPLLFAFVDVSENISTGSLYLAIYASYILCGLVFFRNQKNVLSKIYIAGTVISLCTMLSAVLLSNLPLISSLAYTPLAVCLSFIPLVNAIDINEKVQEDFTIKNRVNVSIFAIILLVIFQRFLIVSTTVGITHIYEEQNYIRTGPEKGIVSTLANCNEKKIGLEDWKNNVSPDDTVLIARGFGIDVSDYLLAGAKIASNSVISTPSFNDTLGAYWQLNPEKKPTVIAVSCWDGSEFRTAEQWIYDVIDSEYKLVYEGTYWNFYKPYIQN